MEIIKDKDLIFDIGKYDAILIGTNIQNSLGNGFQKKIALNFPYVNEINKASPYGDQRKLGTVKVIPARENNPIFCLLYINKGRYRPDLNPDYLDYPSLEKCMNLINKHLIGKNIATTLIGNSLFDGNGNRDKILKILEDNSSNFNLTVYDYLQADTDDEKKRLYYIVKDYIGTEDYFPMKKKYLWQQAFGELTPYPENFEEMTCRQLKQYIKEKKQGD